MEIMKFKIDESTARSANLMNSFDDYKDGSETETYLSYLNKFSNTVDELKQRAKVEVTKEIEDAIQYYANRYSYKIAQSINRRNQIEAMCPSVMISGAGNFPILFRCIKHSKPEFVKYVLDNDYEAPEYIKKLCYKYFEVWNIDYKFMTLNKPSERIFLEIAKYYEI